MIEHALIISLTVFALHASAWEGMIFGKIREYISPDSIVAKPLYNCPICMTPYYGSAIAIGLMLTNTYSFSLYEFILTIGAATGFSTIFAIINMIEDKL